MRETAGGARDAFGLLSFLVAVALILHQLWWGGFEVASPHFAVVLAAAWTILSPCSVGRFALMLGAEVVSASLEMPGVHSHTLLVLVSGASILAYLAVTTLRARRPPDPGAVFTAIAPFLRAQVMLVYAAAGIAKLNTGFLDPALSCAAGLSGRIAWLPASLAGGEWRVGPAIWGTVAIELALPVLLAFRRTRLVGLGLGVGFHVVLALAGNVPFSALMLALYVAFLPEGTASRARVLLRRRPSVLLPAVAGGWLAAGGAFAANPVLGREAIGQGTRVAVVLLALGAVALLAGSRGRPWPATPTRRLGHPVFAAGLAVLLLNALSPYAGFKTESAFAMFSNLQTEPGSWNHVLIPEAVRVLGYQDRLVRITATNDPVLRRRGRDGRRLVGYELERYLRRRPASTASYVAVAGGGGDRAAWATPLLDRVAKFRDVRAPGRPGC